MWTELTKARIKKVVKPETSYWQVTLEFGKYRQLSSNFASSAEAMKYIKDNPRIYSPSEAEITMNGRYSCD